MDKELLKWGIENSDPEKLKDLSGFDPKSLDPELVDFIINGRTADGSKALTLRECVEFIKTREDANERLAAFEHLHMLVEEIDHAISMENLGLWPDIISIAQSADFGEEMRMWAFWTMASAAQHNTKTQEALIKHGVLPLAFTTLESELPFKIRQKSMLLISALVKQCMPGFIEFTKLSGMQKLAALFSSEREDATMKQRISFFFVQLFDERPRLKLEHPELFSAVNASLN